MKELLFSAQGRLARAAFWKGVLMLVVGMIGVSIVFSLLTKVFPSTSSHAGQFEVHGAAAIPYLILTFGSLIVFTWAGICLGIKRFHDRGKPGAWVLIQFVPLIGPIWYVVEVGFLAGTPGPNDFGPDPLAAPGAPALAAA